MTKHKEVYEVPAMEVVEVKYEGVICTSPGTSTGVQDYGWNDFIIL